VEYTIGQFSKKTGISIQTLRFYDREGVLGPEKVTSSSHRIYGQSSIKYARVVQQSKENGFSLKEIAAIMTALTTSKSCLNLLKMVDKRLAEIQEQKKQLNKSEKFLKKLSSSCPSGRAGKNCKGVEEF